MARVTFPTISPFLFRNFRDTGRAPRPIDGVCELYVPEATESRRPGVVVIEGLGGLKNARERAYGAVLAEQGCVALVVDSFGARGAAWLPDDIRALGVTEAMMTADAYAALRFLCRHPAVDPDRIYVFGFSYGGMISVLLAYRQFAELLAPDGERFAGHVSYYGCSIPRLDRPETTGAPVLMMLGECDRNVSIPRSEAIADDLRRGGSPVDLEVVGGAYHQWDGNDVEKRHVMFNLQRCAIRVDTENETYDEKSGMRVRGPITRGLVMLRRADPRGYDILRNEKFMRHSDRRLMAFIGSEGEKTAIRHHVETTRPPDAADDA